MSNKGFLSNIFVLELWGVFIGAWMSLRQNLNCHPWHHQGQILQNLHKMQLQFSTKIHQNSSRQIANVSRSRFSSGIFFLTDCTNYFSLKTVESALVLFLKVVALWIIFPQHQELSHLDFFRLRYVKNTTTYPVSLI